MTAVTHPSFTCIRERGIDPVSSIKDALRTSWGDNTRVVHWPLALKIGRA